MTFNGLSLLAGFETLLCAALLAHIAGKREGVRLLPTPHSIALALVSLFALAQYFADSPLILFCALVVSAVLQIEGLLKTAKISFKKKASAQQDAASN